MLFSGRIDMVFEEEIMLEIFNELTEFFESEYFLFCFEDKSKSGLSTKPHYHYLIEIDSELKSDTIRRKVHALLENHGIGKSERQIKEAKLDEKAHYYVLKQGDIVYRSDIENIDELIEMSKDYNETVKHYTQAEILEVVKQQLIEEKVTDPIDIVERLCAFIYDYNYEHGENYYCKYLSRNALDNFIYSVLSRTKNKQQFIEYYMKRTCPEFREAKRYEEKLISDQERKQYNDLICERGRYASSLEKQLDDRLYCYKKHLEELEGNSSEEEGHPEL